MPKNYQNDFDKEAFYALLKLNFKSFCEKVFHEVAGDNPYLDNWHISVVCGAIEEMRVGPTRRLIINLPPRYMKSIICSVALPAFLLGHNPKERILCVSYSEELSLKLALDQRKVMQTDWYQDIFPFTRLSKSKHSIGDFETTAGGGRFSTTVGGTITGRGGNWIIIDDPIKPSDAHSDGIREKVNDWYGHTLHSRLDNKQDGRILLVMQRTHINDLTGHLLETDKSFKLVKLPILAIQDEQWIVEDPLVLGKEVFSRRIGEPLHKEREGLSQIQNLKDIVGSYTYASQYQQEPECVGGNIIRREWIRTYNYAALLNQVRMGQRKLRICQSWDTASKAEEDNDYSVCITYAHDFRKRVWVLDIFRAKLEFPELEETAKRLALECRQRFKDISPYMPEILIEDMNSGIGLAQALKLKLGSCVKPIKPVQDKATRLKTVSYLLENGTCLFPDDNPEWWGDFEQELLQFPYSRHDDQCDALSQLLMYEQNERKDLSWLDHV